jgi:hypothetical protein
VGLYQIMIDKTQRLEEEGVVLSNNLNATTAT